jgi:hypothetical protein
VDIKDGKVTVIRLVDPVDVVTKLRKNGWPCADLTSIGPWPEKKDGDKKDGGGSNGGGGGKKKDGGKKRGGGKEDSPNNQVVWHPPPPPQWHPQQQPSYQQQRLQYVHPRTEKNPNECVIC